MKKIQEVINQIRSETPWVNYNQTRDVVLCGEDLEKEITAIGVCWVLTKEALHQAIQQNIHFVISHENFLYLESTNMWKGYRLARNEKLQQCKYHDIVVYRLHDGWDMFPEYGVADSLNRLTGLPFEKRVLNSYHSKAFINGTLTVQQIAQRYADALKRFGCDSVEILADPQAKVQLLATGVGAATHLEDMIEMGADCVVISDDGANNWVEHQWLLDHQVPAIILHHSVNEMAGMISMVDYLRKKWPDLQIVKLQEGYHYHTVAAQ